MDSRDVLTRTADLPDAVVRYADHEDGVIDLHLPRTGGPHPLVVMVHGGFWKQAYDRRHVRPMARALVEQGLLVAVPEYRRVGGAGGWPMTAYDVEAAVAALPDLLDGLGLETTTTTLAGHSAGGHLVLWLTARGILADRVVPLAPVGDLHAAARESLGGGAPQALLGGEPDLVPELYAEADPAVLLDTGASAAVDILHGSADDVVPVANSRGLVERQPFVALHELDGAGHYDLIDPDSAAWPRVLAALRGEP